MTTPLAKAIKRTRSLRSQAEFADELAVSRVTVSTWERGLAVPRGLHARLLVAQGVSEDLFFPDYGPSSAGEVA